uniref:Uncharacterized protein n=1 Tax=Tanacetum cinerariifolium TaxID=118510 RepID=A0A6L2NHZ6_TANCI|nr:hypothetical protein [Tanacetum cinerariifolium]
MPLLKKFALLMKSRYNCGQRRGSVMIQQYLQNEHYALWEVIEFVDSYEAPKDVSDSGSASEGSAKKKGRTIVVTTEDMQKRRNDVKARTTLLLALPDEHQLRFKGKEMLEQTFIRLRAIVSHLGFMNVEIEQDDLNQKFLTSLAPEWLMYTIVLRNRSDLDTMSLDDLSNHLKVYEPKVQKKSESNSHNMAFNFSAKNRSGKEEKKTGKKITIQGTDVAGFDKSKVECFNCHKMGHFTKECRSPRSQDRGRREVYKQGSKIEEQTPKALMAIDRIRGREFKVESKDNRIGRLTKELEELKKEKEGLDSKLIGFQSASKDLDTLLGSQSDSFVSKKGDSSKSIMSKSMIKFVKATDSPTEVIISKVKTVRKPSVKYAEMYRNNTKNPKFDHLAYDCGVGEEQGKTWPKNNNTHKRYWDSGCSRHMTDNISYLSDYEPYDGGVSQIYENKNSVLFTASECIVLGRDFKQKDDTNVLLRTPRQHNMYSIDLNNIVPHKDLNCLVAKASTDECILWHTRLGHLNFKTMNKLVRHNLVRGLPSKCFENDHTYVTCLKGKQHKAFCKIKLVNSVSKPLHTLHMDLFGPTSVSSLNHKWYYLVVTDDFSRFTWTFFLKTKDETSGILRNFITEIENLKDLKVKIIRCDNRGEFRNKEMNDFCSRKGIKKEFNNARTPQQNGVGKRRNRTLIEAARTMLADAKLPVTFWAEAVNTAYYVQNRVLVNKDEGYFIGYSMSSKAFRVFNKRTKRVEENLHVDFLENKLIEKGAGPNWLFNIDTLTNSMNYVPVVVAGTTSTNFLGTKDAASQDVKKDVSFLRYIALPNWFHEAHLESSTSNAQDACNADASESSRNSNPTATSTNPPADHMETLIAESPIPTVSSLVPTACLDDFPEPSSDTRLISKRLTSQDDTLSLDNILTLSNRFEDILGVTTNTGDTNGVEADLGNIENNISAIPTPTFRIHKDHAKSQIIGLVDTPVQTKTKSNEMEEQSFIATIHQKTNPALLQFCLFSCFLSQEEPKKIFDALKDPSWDERGIVIENKARIVAQGRTQEEGIDYEEVFAPVARIEAIRLFLAYASFMGFIVYQMDVKSAFLYGTIDEEVYVMQPSRFLDPEFPARVYKVEKEMYALRQAPRAWYGDILKKFGYSNVRSANTPIDKENPWGKDGTGKDVDLHLYRSMIGSLMYLNASRPDIMFAVCTCAKHQVTPKECHLHAVKRIFRYLKGHPKLGLWYPKESLFDLVAYSDSDYGGATQDRKSTTEGC